MMELPGHTLATSLIFSKGLSPITDIPDQNQTLEFFFNLSKESKLPGMTLRSYDLFLDLV